MPIQVLPRNHRTLKQIAALISAGEVVACATETAYGLLAVAKNRQAVASIVKMKGREPGKPIALLAADLVMVKKHFRLTRNEVQLAKKLWPGPLTLLLKPKHKFPSPITGPDGLVGVRVPGNKWLRLLVAFVKFPLTATSANRAGSPTPYTARVVKKSLGPRGLRFLVEAGRLRNRPTSTVVRLVNDKIVIIRPGAVPFHKLTRVLS